MTNHMHKYCSNNSDEYYTPAYAVYPILKYLKPNSTIWCPFDTAGSNFVKVLKKEGFNVIYSHIWEDKDFFTTPIPSCDYIISNPPYSRKGECINKLFAIGKPFAMLVSNAGIFESQFRFNMFANNEFEMLIFNKRVQYKTPEAGVMARPPFLSVYITSKLLPKQIVFEQLDTERSCDFK